MASLVLGGVGAVVGGYFGGPQGAAWGYAIGSAVGSAIDPEVVKGPQLSAMQVTDSTYGNPVPIVYGVYRTGGMVIWQGQRVQTQNKSGGKGGGPVAETFSYSISTAVAVCRGPIVGIRRIWANKTLIYDTGSLTTGSAIEANDSLTSSIIVYNGDEEQMPDPTIVADAAFTGGPTRTPAYRGLAYVVFNNLQLANFGNVPPQFEFEVVANGVYAGAGLLASSLIPIGFVSSNNTIPNNPHHVPLVGRGHVHGYKNGVIRMGTLDAGIVWLFDDHGNYLGQEESQAGEEPFPGEGIGQIPFAKVGGGLTAVYFDANQVSTPLGSQSSPKLKTVGAVSATGAQGQGGFDMATALPAGEYLVGAYRCSDQESILCAIASHPDRPPYKWAIVAAPAGASAPSMVKTGTMVRDHDASVINSGDSDGYPLNTVIGCMESDFSRVWLQPGNSTSVNCYQMIDGAMKTAEPYYDPINNTYKPVPIAPLDFWPFNDNCLWADFGCCVLFNSDYMNVITVTESLTGTGISPADIVSDLCAQAGLAPDEIDVSQLATMDLCKGYLIAGQMTPRSAIEMLAQRFKFDSTESDYKLKFVARGAAPVALIPMSDMAANEGSSLGDVGDAITLTRLQEADLPQSLGIKYPDPSLDYQINQQLSRMPGTSSVSQTTYSVPIVMDHDEAAQVADVLLYAAWTGRNTFEFSVGRKWSWLDPTDVIQFEKTTIDGTVITQTGRIQQKSSGANGVIDLTVVSDESNVYISNATGATSSHESQQISIGGPTALRIMNTPTLRDADDGPGVYVAASGYLPSWKGASLWESIDSRNYSQLAGYFKAGSVMGAAVSALGDWAANANVFDEKNTVDVRVFGGGELFSQSAAMLFSGANACLLGDEVLQFREAELIEAGVYRLSGLLRARKGTELALGTHAAGEQFCMLSGGALDRIPQSTAEIGATRYFKAPSADLTIDQAATVAAINTGRSLLPLSPVYGQGYFDGTDWTLTWIRRGRLSQEWMDNVDVPIGEASESYFLEILSDPAGSSVVRSATVSSASFVYDLASQIADFGAPQSIVYARVAQLSALVGKGPALVFTVETLSEVDPHAAFLVFEQNNRALADLKSHPLTGFNNVSVVSGGNGGWNFLTGYAAFGHTGLSFGTGDFTIECFITPSHLNDSATNGSFSNIFDTRIGGSDSAGMATGIDSAGRPYCFTGTGMRLNGVGSIPVGTRGKYVLQRKAGILQFWLNDVLDSSTPSTDYWSNNNMLFCVSNESPINYFCGRLENFKIYAGIAKY